MEAALRVSEALPWLCSALDTTIPTQMPISLTALLLLNGLKVIDQGQDPSDRAGFIDAFAPFWLAKHLAPNRHVTGPMSLHLLTAVNDPIHLPEWELALVFFA